MSDSVRPHRWQPSRLRPWDSPGKNTGVGCHFLLQCMKVNSESEVTQLCPTLHDPMNCSLPGSSVLGILQARTLEWVAISFSNAWKRKLSRVWLFTTPWTAAYQAPLSMGVSRQEYWNGLPLPSPAKLLYSCQITKTPSSTSSLTYISHFSYWKLPQFATTKSNLLAFLPVLSSLPSSHQMFISPLEKEPIPSFLLRDLVAFFFPLS